MSDTAWVCIAGMFGTACFFGYFAFLAWLYSRQGGVEEVSDDR